MKKVTAIMCLVVLAGAAQEKEPKIVERNGMTVRWYHANHRIHLEMTAPTKGWVAIGFHEEPSLTGAYLVMGAVAQEKITVAEHYVRSPGHYQRIEVLDGTNQIEMPDGEETDHFTHIAFSLPLNIPSPYRKSLYAGQSYHLTLAYSREDDFQHHSMMRTSLIVTL